MGPWICICIKFLVDTDDALLGSPPPESLHQRNLLGVLFFPSYSKPVPLFEILEWEVISICSSCFIWFLSFNFA